MVFVIESKNNKKFIFSIDILDEGIELCRITNIKYYDIKMITQVFEYLICKYIDPYTDIYPPYYILNILKTFILETKYYKKICNVITKNNEIIDNTINNFSVSEKLKRRKKFMNVYKDIFGKDYEIIHTYEHPPTADYLEVDEYYLDMNSYEERYGMSEEHYKLKQTNFCYEEDSEEDC